MPTSWHTSLAAFFEGSKPKERESRRRAYQEAILNREPRRHAVEVEERRNAGRRSGGGRRR